MDEHRVPMLGGAWRRRSDPQRSADPRVRELIGALAGLPVAPDPRPDFRAELRAQLVAVTPRLVAEGEPTPAAEPREAVATPKTRTARRRLPIVKPLIAAACVLGAFVLLLGGAVLISQHALPGDALYGIKRAGENTEYSLAGSAVDRGKLKLEFAARRIGEVTDLLPRASALSAGTGAVADGGGLNADTAGLVRDTLHSADGDIQTAAQLLDGAAVRTGDHAPLDAITSWTPGQLTAMHRILARVPAGGVHRAAEQTLTWLRAAQQRAARLGAELSCSCLDPANTDALGPRPCTGPCSSAAPARRHHKTQPAGKRASTRHGHPAGQPGSTVPGTRTVPGRSTGPTTPTATTTTEPARTRHSSSPGPIGAPPTTVSTPKVPLPSIPGLIGGSSPGSGKGSTGVQVPITVSSSCVQLSAGAIQIGVGHC
jgi:hypothetical protein